MPITLNGPSGVSTPGVASTDAVTGTTAAFSGNVTVNGIDTFYAGTINIMYE